MSQDNQNGVPTASPTEQQMIPKERFDELIQERRFLQEQLQTTQEMLRHVVPQRQFQQAPQEVEPPELAQLREDNPNAYALIKQQQMALKQQQATSFIVMDELDRVKYLNEFGEEGKKYLTQVERELDSLRQRGIANFNRGQIFVHLKGQEAIKTPKNQAASYAAPQAQVPTNLPKSTNVPSSDPVAAATTAGSAASSSSGVKTLEDIEREIGDIPL